MFIAGVIHALKLWPPISGFQNEFIVVVCAFRKSILNEQERLKRNALGKGLNIATDSTLLGKHRYA